MTATQSIWILKMEDLNISLGGIFRYGNGILNIEMEY